MLQGLVRHIRLLMANLMLITGVLGQAGHSWAHHDQNADWQQAMEAEQRWLGTETPFDQDVDTHSVIIFAVGHGSERSGDEGGNGHHLDHHHGLAFLQPPGPTFRERASSSGPLPTVLRGLTVQLSNRMKRPPRIT